MCGLEERLCRLLGTGVSLAWARDGVAPARLSRGEMAQWQLRARGRGGQDWLRGRAALKALLGDGADTSSLIFPHRSLSLSHAGGVAVALRSQEEGCGIGVDFEPQRSELEAGIARFFLSPQEAAAAGGAVATLMALWTVKEALYKATPHNAGLTLSDFELADTTAACGAAVGPRGEALRYAALEVGPCAGCGVPAGHLAVAVCTLATRGARRWQQEDEGPLTHDRSREPGDRL